MNLKIVKTIFFKEMLDTFRDKRTIIAMIGVPIVLYPVVFLVAAQIAIVQQNKLDETISTIAITGNAPESMVQAIANEELVELKQSEDPAADIANRELDVHLILPEEFQNILDDNKSAELVLEYDATEGRSREAMDRVDSILDDYHEQVLKLRLDEQKLEMDFVHPITLDFSNVAPPAKSTGSLLGMVLPLLLVVMLGVGAFYPAVDLTAGEKERGTFETLLSTPTSKLEIIFGKFLTVFTLSMLTGFLNLASMIATLLFQVNQIAAQGDNLAFDVNLLKLPPSSVLSIILILVPLAFFISAVMMTVSIMAKSFKEAQNYVSPVFIGLVIPATIVSIPNVELNQTTQFIPVSNVALLFRDLMMGTATPNMVFVVFLCTAIYALLSLVFATWMFQREEVILSNQGGIPITFNRSQIQPMKAPTPGISMGMFAFVMILLFYGGTYAQGRDLMMGMVVTQFGLILTPILAILWYLRIDVRTTLNLRFGGNLISWCATVLLVVSWVPLIFQMNFWQQKVLPAPEGLEILQKELLSGGNTPVGLMVLLLVIAVSPAICEEVMFRGVLVSGLRNRMPQWATILTVGVLFGLFHLSVFKILPTAVMGLFLTYLTVRSGSIYFGMLGHFVNNALAVLLGTENFPGAVISYLNDHDIEKAGLPLPLIAGAVVAFLVAVVMFELSIRSKLSRE
jgi:sodium transport system permease protein